MFKIDFLNYKINSYILIFLSFFTILFEVKFNNQLLFIIIFFFSIFQNFQKYQYKSIISSLFALIAIYLQFEFNDKTISKEFFINVVFILVFIKFSEIKKKKDHYFFNFTIIFLTISSLIYGQDFLSSLNSFALMIISIIHLYSLNQKKVIKLNFKNLLRYMVISFVTLLIIFIIYLVFPRYEINIKIFSASQNTLGIPEILKLGSFTDITNNNQKVFLYETNRVYSKKPIYFRVKTFDLINNEKYWISTPTEIINSKFGNVTKINKKKLTNTSNEKLIIYPNNKTWLPILTGFEYDNTEAINDYLKGTANSKNKINKKISYDIHPSQFNIEYDKNILKFYQKIPTNIFSKRLITWTNTLRKNSISDLDYLNKLMQHFGNGEYFYTLSPSSNNDNDYEKFFFQNKKGYCEYYAGMFTILARLQNIPARIVTGYMGGQFNELGNFHTFRQSDAHSWVEVYIDNAGWKRFDPTLAIPKNNILSFNNFSNNSLQANFNSNDDKISKFDKLKLYYSYFDYTWTNKFLDYNKKSRNELLKNKFKSFELTKNYYILILFCCLLLVFAKLLQLIIFKKLFFSYLFYQIKTKNKINNKVYTHQQIYKLLNEYDKTKLIDIFEIYEKITFTKNYDLKIKSFLNINYRILKYSYFRK